MSVPETKMPVETPAEWLRFAKENLEVAERELTYDVPAYHTICFLCQSAAEKYLKGYLIGKGWSLEKTHDIVVLLGRCMKYDSEFGDLREDGSVLNEYMIAGRYPGDIAFETIGITEAQEAVAIVRRIRSLVLKPDMSETTPVSGS